MRNRENRAAFIGGAAASFPIHIGRSFYPAVPVVMQRINSIFLEESKFLKEMAEQSDCVIFGRCAGVVLREHQPPRIFVYAASAPMIKCKKTPRKSGGGQIQAETGL